jgi:hypothetical protein
VVFGFTNRWYEYAFDNPSEFDLGDGIIVRAINPPLFLCTKIDAHNRRGKDDYAMSKDIEDVIRLIDGRQELLEEIRLADKVIFDYLCEWCRDRLSDRKFLDTITWNLPGDEASQAREQIILDRMTAIAKLIP